MGNKMKKLVCALLASAMLISSVGVVSFADAEKSEDENNTEVTSTLAPDATEAPEETAEPETTVAPEATATPEATEAPVAVTAPSSSYDSDNYYQKALALCSSLGIISGYEDGSVKPDSNVTRAEMASIVLRTLAFTTFSKYENSFRDVDASHWAADQIQTAMQQSIVSGMGDGTFQPDGNVTYAQVLVMLVNALNYNYEAERFGGWPNGYIQEAEQLGITKSVKGVSDVPSTRGEVIKMVYNTLLTDYRDIVRYESGNPVYKSEKTLAETKFEVLEGKGTLWATDKTTLTTSKMQENQVQIEKTKPADNEEAIKIYDCVVKGLEEYLAQKVTFYYRENSGLMPEVLAVTGDASKSDSFVINDVLDIEKVTGFDTGAGSIKMLGVSRAKDCTGARIIYNGKLLTNAIYEDLKNNAKASQKPLFGDDLNSLLTPETGSVRLVDSDKDGVYDVVFVDSYTTVIVTSASSTKLNGKIADPNNFEQLMDVSYDFNEDEDRTITVTKGGSEARVRNLKEDDVASVKASLDNTVVDIVVTGESIIGSASGVSKRQGESKATINGTKYDVADVAAGDLKSGTQSTFYLDKFGRVARIEAATAGQLESGEKYGWIMDAYVSDNGEDYIIKMLTTEGKEAELTLAEKSIQFWGSTDKAASTKTATEVMTELSKADDGAYLKSTYEYSMIKNNQTVTVKVPIRLVKYKTSTAGAITRLYLAIDETVAANKDLKGALKMNPNGLNGQAIQGGLVAGYKMEDGGLEISVPKKTANMKYAENYKIGTASASAYAVRENGSSRSFIVGECGEASNPTVFINFTDSDDETAKITDMDTNANNPTMVVTSIDSTIDDDDNPVYVINGYSGHSEVSVTTTKNAVVAKLNGNFSDKGSYGVIAGEPRRYKTTNSDGNLWEAMTPNGNSLTDFISEGDVILCDGGSRILIVVDADDVYNQIVKGQSVEGLTVGRAYNSFNTRNMFSFGRVVNNAIGSDDVMTLDTVNANGGSALDSMAFDVSRILDMVEISTGTDGKAVIKTSDDGLEVYDIEKFSEADKTGDIAIARYADKGTLQEITIYRFK